MTAKKSPSPKPVSAHDAQREYLRKHPEARQASKSNAPQAVPKRSKK